MPPLAETAATVRLNCGEVGDALEDLRSKITDLQIMLGTEEMDGTAKKAAMSNLSVIWVAVDKMTTAFVGDGEKKEGIQGDLAAVVSTILAYATQPGLPMST